MICRWSNRSRLRCVVTESPSLVGDTDYLPRMEYLTKPTRSYAETPARRLLLSS